MKSKTCYLFSNNSRKHKIKPECCKKTQNAHVTYRKRSLHHDMTNELLKRLSYKKELRNSNADPPPHHHIVDICKANRNECLYCGRTVSSNNVDELVPITKGGRMSFHNRVPCCGGCNSSKGAKDGYDLTIWLIKHNPVSVDKAVNIADYVEKHEKLLTYQGDDLDDIDSVKRCVIDVVDQFDSVIDLLCR